MRKFSILLVFAYVTIFSVFNFVIADNPSAPFTPSQNIQDPGDPSTPDTNNAGCGPTDPNCYVTVSSLAGPITIVNTTSLFSTGLTNTGLNSDAEGSIFLGDNAGNGATNASYSNFFGDSAGSDATDAESSNFFGSSAGEDATNADDSNFFSENAGNGATDADSSNFFGNSAGFGATDASDSNFFGEGAGFQALNASNSNFFGYEAGSVAHNASNSIFIGEHAGFQDTVDNSTGGYSILLGPNTDTGNFSNSIAMGRGATNTSSNQLVFGSDDASSSIGTVFFGTGVTASSPASVVINGSGASGSDTAGASLTFAGGKGTGNAAGGAIIFQTSDAGASGATLQSLTTKATLLASGNFGIGDTTPASLFTVGNGDLFQVASDGSIDAITGYIQGSGTMSLTSANTNQTTTSSIFSMSANSLTTGTGFYGGSSTLSAGSLMNLVVTGTAALGDLQKVLNVSTSGANSTAGQTTYGGYFTNTHTGSFSENIGLYSSATGGATTNTGLYAIASGGVNNYAIRAEGIFLLDGIRIEALGSSLSLGANSNATGSINSFFVVDDAGSLATNADNAIFIGNNAGANATNASNSSFFGHDAGAGATNADNSNFFGHDAGGAATNADNSNFFGDNAGSLATNADYSNFFGYQAGNTATNATKSIFLGYQAGEFATNAANSIFIGENAGRVDSVDNTVSGYSILIGPDTSTGGVSNSIAVGKEAFNSSANQLVFGSDNFPISGIFFGTGALSASPQNAIINGSGAFGADIAGGALTLAGGKATGNAAGGSLIFQTSDVGASGATLQSLTTKATILPSGFFGINDTTPDYRLDIETDVASYVANFFNDGNATTRSGILIQGGLDDHTAVGPSTLIGFQDGDGGAVGSITFGSSATAYNTTSDQRLKDTVSERTESSLDLLNQIQIHDFTWKGDTHNTIYTGVYAQELYDVYPHAVTKPVNNADNWMVDYSKLTPVVVASIQDLDIKLQEISDFEEDSPFLKKFQNWIGNNNNGIKKLFVKDTICIGEICINEEQLKALLQNAGDAGENTEQENHPVEDNTGDDTIEEPVPEEVIPEEENTNDELEEIINQEESQQSEENYGENNEEDQSSN